MKKKAMRKRIKGLEKDTAELVAYQLEIEKEIKILKAKLEYAHYIYDTELYPLKDRLKDTRESFSEEYTKRTGIENPDLSNMKFLEDFLPETLSTLPSEQGETNPGYPTAKEILDSHSAIIAVQLKKELFDAWDKIIEDML